MGRKVVREKELVRSGVILVFPRTGCALSGFAGLITRAVKSALRSDQPNAQRARVALVLRALTWARKLPDGRQPLVRPGKLLKMIVWRGGTRSDHASHRT